MSAAIDTRRDRRPVRTALVFVTLVGMLLASGCGARWSARQRAAVVARERGGLTTSAGSATQAGDPTAPAGAEEPGAPGEAAVGATGATSGSGSSAASGASAPGADVQAAAPSARPCAAPSTAPGVTAKDLTIASITTLSGAVPGLGASSLAAVRSYVAYRNSIGGVCGRRLVLKTVDDGMDSGRYRAAVNEISPQVLGIVGGVAGGDAGGTEVVEQKKIPVVSTYISTTFGKVSTVFGMNPRFADVNKPIAKYRYLRDQGVRKVALVYIAVDQTRQEIQDKQKPQMIASGLSIVHQQEVPLSTLSFDSAARGVANSGADYLFFLSEAGQSASMAKSMRDTGYKLKFEEYLTAYGSNFIELAGAAAADGTTSWIRTLPNEEASSNPELDTYLKWMRQTAPEAVVDTFAADGWAATKAFVDGVDALPGPIARDALITQLRSVKSYDAAGFMGPIQLGAKLNNGCFIAMKVVGGKWRRLTPARGFLC